MEDFFKAIGRKPSGERFFDRFKQMWVRRLWISVSGDLVPTTAMQLFTKG